MPQAQVGVISSPIADEGIKADAADIILTPCQDDIFHHRVTKDRQLLVAWSADTTSAPEALSRSLLDRRLETWTLIHGCSFEHQ